ncbi:MAG: hypothetical protein JXM79_13330 [Sedimentisphaerales bacterium]|nr:hypothetical protein [Sedimentisphaerales bacterium]
MCKKLILLVSMVMLVPLSAVKAGDPDLLGWWNLDEGGGDIAFDSSDKGNHGTIYNTSTGGLGEDGSVWLNDPDRGNVCSFTGLADGAYVRAGNIPIMTLDINFTWAFWAKDAGNTATPYTIIVGNRRNVSGADFEPRQFIKFTPVRFEWHMNRVGENIDYDDIPEGVWLHHAVVKAGDQLTYYRDGVEADSRTITQGPDQSMPFFIGGSNLGYDSDNWRGLISNVCIYQRALTEQEVNSIMMGGGKPNTSAYYPSPADGSLHENTTATLSWIAGEFAVSHDVYFGDNRDDVENGAADTFRGNQETTSYAVGSPGSPYPDGLVPGTTYYWRIDEVNETDPNSPWKGDIWSFSIPPKTAYDPYPADGADSVITDRLIWTPGIGAILHTVYFGDSYNEVDNATGEIPSESVTYQIGFLLKAAKTYYWRVDEYDGVKTYKGDIWSFCAKGGITNPNPANGAVDITQAPTLTWTAGIAAAAHEIYLGTDPDAVQNATTASPEYQGTQLRGNESFEPGSLAWNTTYYWRVDEVNDANPDSPWTGPVWSFTTSGFAIVDDFESYTDNDGNNEAIWQHWTDGFGVADNGSQVGYLLPPYAERKIVHGGSQSMPLMYANEAGVKNSEAALTLTSTRDWTVGDVEELLLWIRGKSDNAAEPLYVAISNSAGAVAVVAHDDPSAAQVIAWTEWRIPLRKFSDQGINLTDVDQLAIGLGSKSGLTSAGGTGTVYIDDIRLYKP